MPKTKRRRIKPVELPKPARVVTAGTFIDRGPYASGEEQIRVDGPGVVTERALDEVGFRLARRVKAGLYVVTKRLFRVEYAH